jgi:membrane protease YdiL (CAAX protease family)
MQRESVKLLAGLAVIYALFHWLATALGSTRGESGILIGAVIVIACIVAERLLFGERTVPAARSLGLGRPATRGLVAATGVSVLMLLVIPLFAVANGARMEMYPGWALLVPGLFAQAGIAEETLFRGYLFRRMRVGRTFWRAAALATIPFVAVHLVIFLTQPWMIAAASVALAAIIALPLAHLFEIGGRTIWAPAIVHFVVQGAIKVVVIPGEAGATLPLVWMAAAAVIPFGVLVVRRFVGPGEKPLMKDRKGP